MMYWYETIPREKMPDEEIIQNHTHYVKLRIPFEKVYRKEYSEFVADLTKYYDWAKENGIFMEHNLLVQSDEGKKSLMMFVFEDEPDAMAFKLRWK